jgi:glucose-1-phosphate thymidylyltransferase
LGDNIFFGQNSTQMLESVDARKNGAPVFGCPVHGPERYGVIAFSPDNRALLIEKKPAKPKANFAVTGLYISDGCTSEIVTTLERSAPGRA